MMNQVVTQHAESLDGYRTLFDLMVLSCSHLKLIQEKWGPTWEPTMTPYQYTASLESKIIAESRRNRCYTRLETAAEMLQQSLTVPRYQVLGATLLMTVRGFAQTKVVPPIEFEPKLLAATFVQSAAPDTSLQFPRVNKMFTPSDGKSEKPRDGSSTFPRKSRTHKQCDSCKRYGHCISKQVCHFTAQVENANVWIKGNPGLSTKNAETYVTTNIPRVVRKIEADFSDRFQPTMTYEEREDVRSELHSSFLPDLHSDEHNESEV
jgi:hypothetical protein